MKELVHNFWFRLLASGAFASLVVIVIVGGAIRYYTPPPQDPTLSQLKEVRIVNLAENPLLAEAIRKEREKHGEAEPEREVPPPPPPRPERQVSGFVQLEYTINPDGTVSDVVVLGSAPAGVYEQQAIARISRSMHAPMFNDAGEAIARRTNEIIEFSVPASELRNSRLESK